MAKHLIIGLGGTGGNVICEFRKRIYEEYRAIDPQVKDVFVDYLYVDSSKEDLEGVDKDGKKMDSFRKKWSILGEDVRLSPAQTLFIGGMEAAKLDNLYRYNNLNSFFTEEDRRDTAKGLDQIIGAGIGGQRRRFGRLLFSNSMQQDSFNERIRARVEALYSKANKKGKNEENVTFHICAGLGGGTGSGTIIDAIAQIRKMFPHTAENGPYRICLYLYIPEALKNSDRDKEGYYRPNGYAALAELNALSVGAYQPIDISDVQNISADKKRLKESGFEAAYIYTDHNGVGDSGNKYSLDELSKISADFLFQKLFADISSRFEDNENVGSSSEVVEGRPVHSRKFLSFGVKRLIYPETEINEYASYKFLYTSVMQMIWGWPKGARYPVELSEEQVNVSPNEIKGKDDSFAMRGTLHITDTLLKVDSEFFDKQIEAAKTSQWKSFKDYWESMADQQYNVLLKEDKNTWLPTFRKRMLGLYSQYFRGNGVQSFFSNCKRDKGFLADETINYIDSYLMGQWKDGKRSLAEIEKFVQILIDDCRERFERYDKSIADCRGRVNKYSVKANELYAKFNKSGFLSGLFGLDAKTFAEYKQCLIGYYLNMTEIESYEFAKELMRSIIDKLEGLHTSVASLKDTMISYAQSVFELSESKCQKSGNDDPHCEVKKIYDAESIRDLVDNFIHEEGKQKANTTALQSRLISQEPSLRELQKNMSSEDEFAKVWQDIPFNLAKKRFDDYSIENKSDKLLNTNILEQLSKQKSEVDKLEDYCKDAMFLVKKNGNEDGSDELAEKMVQVWIPKDDRFVEFREELIEKIKNIFEGKGFKQGRINVFDTLPSTQIVILTGIGSIPLRYVASVKKLKEEYDKFVKDNVCLYKLVHTESFKTPLPSLFNKTSEELKQELYRTLLLVYSIPGIVGVETNQETGEQVNAVAKKKSEGKDYCYCRADYPDDFASDFMYLGKTIRDTMERLSKNEGNCILLRNLVDEQLVGKYKHNDKKAELRDTISTFLRETILVEYDRNQVNEEFRKYVDAKDQLFESELKEK